MKAKVQEGSYVPDSSLSSKSRGFKKDRAFLNILLDVFLPNLFLAASVLPLSGFALLCFSREPEELSIPLPKATSDLFLPFCSMSHLLLLLAEELSHRLGEQPVLGLRCKPCHCTGKDSRLPPPVGQESSPESLGWE